jgi:hypothetical protein
MAKYFACPVCNSVVDISSVVAEYSYRGFLPPKQGIRCRACSNTLHIVQYKAGAFLVALAVVFGGALYLVTVSGLGNYLHVSLGADVSNFVILVVLGMPLLYAVWHSFDWFTELRLAAPHEDILSDDGIWTDPDVIDPDFVQYVAEEMRIDGHDVGTGIDHRPEDWQCAKCGEENSKEFNLCWNCGESPGPDSL